MKNIFNNPEVRQSFFGVVVKPSQFAELAIEIGEPVVINVWRNTGVEHILPVVSSYFAAHNFETKFQLSYFDSSLEFRTRKEADIDLVYFELNSENFEGSFNLFESKARELAERGARAVAFFIQVHPEISGIFDKDQFRKSVRSYPIEIVSNQDSFLDLSEFFQPRLLGITGNWLSPQIAFHSARTIATKLLLPYITTQIKVLAVDLDNTLYNGVLAEDGPKELFQSVNQISLIKYLRRLKSNGIIICLVSRNNVEDVKNLLTGNNNLNISLDDFDFIYASWEPKENILRAILVDTKIGQDAVLFIDDSVIEIYRAEESFPKIQTLLFSDDQYSIIYLENHPGLRHGNKSTQFKVDRGLDLRQNEQRKNIFLNLYNAQAHQELRVRLTFQKNASHLLPRGAELSAKTNQFNASLKRFNEFDLSNYIDKNNRKLVFSDLQDKFADSGTVSIMAVSISNMQLVVDEFCISCRALGRGLESEIFFGSIRLIFSEFPELIDSISIQTKIGPRNLPFFEWADQEKFVKNEDGTIIIPLSDFTNWRSDLSV